MRSTVTPMSLTTRQRRLVAVLLVVLLSTALLVTLQAQPASAATCPCTIWTADQTPTTPADSDTVPVEVGVKFRADTNGSITGVRFYKAATNSGTHVGNLWTSSGTKLSTVTFTGETGSGWQQAIFATPVPITAGTTYVASYYAPNGRYASDNGYFTGHAVINGPLTALADATDGGNGVYRYGAGGGFPNSSFQGTNYWVDVLFTPDTSAPDTTKPTLTDRQPVPGTTGVPVSTGVSATFSESVQPGSTVIAVTPNVQGGIPVPGTLNYADATRTATFTPSAALSANTVFTVSVSGARDAANNVIDQVSWTFTTATATSGCPCSIWPSTTTPATPSTNDNSAVEVGVKFRTDRPGYITGLRFYKGSGNTGTHVGSLWNATGTKLSSITFINESSTGWQSATLASPVAVNAGTTYVASYYAPVGRYSTTNNFFATAATVNGPLTALRNGTDGGNGVYKYGASGFPNSTYQSTNYFIDVVFDTAAVDTTPPGVTSRTPAPDSIGVAVTSKVTSTFSEAIANGPSITMALKGPGNVVVPATVNYDAASLTATLTPTAALANTTAYTAEVSGARDAANNTMTPISWTFTTAAAPPPPPDQGPGGPIALVTSSANPYSKYLAEILRTEGLNEFTTIDVETLSPATLGAYDVVVLGAVAITTAQATTLSDWVTAGGNLIAMKPASTLSTLLGITAGGAALTDAYLKVDTSTAPGAGIVADTIQYHGDADRYTLAGAQAIAMLYTSSTASTANPAVTLRNVGGSGGQAAAFTYDLGRSVVLTRQGNPAWAGQERDGQTPMRSDDLYFGGSATDWVNLNKVAIPQADEQQRLLANLIQTMNRDRKPLPRFWYFPNGQKAVVISTGDDHGNGGTAGRFDQYLANDPTGCSTTNWTCPRMSSYVYPNSPLSDSSAVAYTGKEFEVGLHPQNNCNNYSPSSLTSTYASDLASWRSAFPSIPTPVSNRFHCLVWSDWSSQPTTEKANGMRLDSNYYYWPGSWLQNRPGFMTGSGMPMRFADSTGTMIDVYQAPTQMTDESGQVYPFTSDTLLDNALSLGYYGAFNANMHTDSATTFPSDQVLGSALERGVPLVSGRQMLTWLDGRNGSSFGNIGWSANTLTFTVGVGAGANGLTGMLPTAGPNGTVLSTLNRAGSAVAVTTSTIKGLEYASFTATGGSYTATYVAPSGGGGSGLRATPSLARIAWARVVEIGNVSAATSQDESGAAASVSWTTTDPATSQVAFGTGPDALVSTQVVGDTTRDHSVGLTDLAGGTTYYYRVTSVDPMGAQQTFPAPGQSPATFTTPTLDQGDPTTSAPTVTVLPDGTAQVSWTTDKPTEADLGVGTTESQRAGQKVGTKLETSHQAVLTDLQPNSTYWVSTSSTDAAGNVVQGPAVPIVTPGPGVAEQSWTSFKRGTTTGQATIGTDGLGNISLSGNDTKRRTGSFTSGLLDAQAMVDWDRMTLHADVPDGAKLDIRVRTGSTSTPDRSWTTWRPVADDERVGGAGSRYIQYKIDLVAKAKSASPVMYSIGFGHNGNPIETPKETG